MKRTGPPIVVVTPVLAAAALFGASPPLCKLFLREADPLWVSSLLYLGSGLGLLVWRMIRRLGTSSGVREAPLRKQDWGYLAGAVASGAVLAPFLLMAGLTFIAASTASLLLNLEVVFTAVLAWALFREGFERRVALGMVIVVSGCAVLSVPEEFALGSWSGSLLVAGACFFWGVDNNLTRGISERDPAQVAMIKGLAGGTVTAVTALSLGTPLPGWPAIGGLLALGALAYGLSLVLFILSLRTIGTVRTAMGFALAPFVGAALSLLLLGEPVYWGFGAGLLLVAGGLYLTLVKAHLHEHLHEAVTHEHAHAHDEHHHHEHEEGPAGNRPHSHPHRHEPLLHTHPHYPDTDHRHAH